MDGALASFCSDYNLYEFHAGLFRLVSLLMGRGGQLCVDLKLLRMASTMYCCELQGIHVHNIDVGVSNDILVCKAHGLPHLG